MEAGNFAAVGSMSPGVEIWDLDVTDSVEPVASLGGELTGAKTPKPGKKIKKGSSRKVPAASNDYSTCCHQSWALEIWFSLSRKDVFAGMDNLI